jgi:exodeoxyribonuclease V alpha subunit
LLEFNPREGGFQRHAGRPIEADAIVIDEASMIDVKLADHLVDAVPEHARLLFVGDVDQLPSVGPGAVLRDVIASGAVPTVRLTRIFRQAEGSAIVENAHRINHGEKPVGDATADGEFFVIERTEAEAAADTIVEMVTRRIPERFGLDAVRDVQVLSPMHKGDAGVGALNARLQAMLNPSGAELKRGGQLFRVGDKVLQLKNDYDREVWNGDIGFVKSVDTEEGALVVDIDGRAVDYEGSEIEDLTLAYAMTTHKSQGGEFAAIVLVMLKAHWIMLSRNLLYTGVTRGKRLVVLVSDPKALSQAIRETSRGVRRTGLAQRLRASGA